MRKYNPVNGNSSRNVKSATEFDVKKTSTPTWSGIRTFPKFFGMRLIPAKMTTKRILSDTRI